MKLNEIMQSETFRSWYHFNNCEICISLYSYTERNLSQSMTAKFEVTFLYRAKLFAVNNSSVTAKFVVQNIFRKKLFAVSEISITAKLSLGI